MLFLRFRTINPYREWGHLEYQEMSLRLSLSICCKAENFLADTKKGETLFRCFFVISLSTSPVHQGGTKERRGLFREPI